MRKVRIPPMTVLGVGPRLALWSAFYTLLIIGLAAGFPGAFHMDFLPAMARIVFGIALLVLGGVLYLFSARTILKGFSEGRLCTTGAYGLCRHPLYASWGLFLIPGIVLLADNWAALSIPVFVCLAAKRLVLREEKWLEARFGKKYRDYRLRVPALLPMGGLKKI